MIFNFSIYHNGSLEAVVSDWVGTETARAEAFRLLQHSTSRSADEAGRGGQTRVVVSTEGTDLFTLTYVAAETPRQIAAAA
jgi:hypothetical protein